jgi:hypothetical protein
MMLWRERDCNLGPSREELVLHEAVDEIFNAAWLSFAGQVGDTSLSR